MSSSIVTTNPVDDVEVSKSEHRATRSTIKTELEHGGFFTAAGAGAAERTSEFKLQDFVSVKDFGAVGDGVANDTTAFASAIAAVTAKEMLVVPQGTYLLDSLPELTNLNAPWLFGLGMPTLKYTGTGNFFHITTGNSHGDPRARLSNLSIVRASGHLGTAILIEDSSGCTFENLYIRYFDTAFRLRNVADVAGGGWCEAHKYTAVLALDVNYGWTSERDNGTSGQSMARQNFVSTGFSTLNSVAAEPVCFNIGANINVYGSFFGGLTLFPTADDAIGFQCAYRMPNSFGQITIENNVITTGTRAVKFTDDATHLYGGIFLDIRGTFDTEFDFDATPRDLPGWLVNGLPIENIGAAPYVSGHEQKTLSVVSSGTTIDAAIANLFRVTHSGAETITAILNAEKTGQEVDLIIIGSSITIQNGVGSGETNNIRLAGATNWSPTPGSLLTLVYDSTNFVWREKSRQAT